MRRVAVKKFKLTRSEARQATAIQQEIDVLERLRDKHVIQFYGTTYHDDNLVLVMEFADGGNLSDAIDGGRLQNWETKRRIGLEVARGLAYIHHENILHRDLKSANVLLTQHLVVKLADFGLALVKTKSASKSSGRTSSSGTLKGTLRWMAPELFVRKPAYSTKSDIFALAVVMWEMAADCTMPFQDQFDNAMVATLICRGEREDIPEGTPDEFRGWIEKCWDHDPVKRPEAIELIEDDEFDDCGSTVLSSPGHTDGSGRGRPGAGTTVDVTEEFERVSLSPPWSSAPAPAVTVSVIAATLAVAA
ncbi:hypothetical protein DFQ26_009139 [Actinomortierella ambigua]|nr:hypothetical protein DFQ26_009139 [Actinomortierella ambigua]